MNTKILIPILALVICVVLGIAGAVFIFGQVSSLGEQVTKLDSDTATLEQKRATLETVQSLVSSRVDVTRLAIPSSNSTAPALAQVKRVAQEEGVIITSVNASSLVIEGTTTNITRFEIKAISAYPQMEAMFSRLEKLLPLINIESLKAEDDGSGQVTINTTLNSYWSPLPQSLPDIVGTLDNLSEDEINLLSQLSEFELPSFEELTPEVATDSGRLDPFIIAQ